MADVIVSNGWDNGVFFYAGIYNGKPEYYSANNWNIYWGEPVAWYYANHEGETYDSSQDDVATPDLATWGVITVTAASSGTTHEGESSISSLSYLRTKKA